MNALQSNICIFHTKKVVDTETVYKKKIKYCINHSDVIRGMNRNLCIPQRLTLIVYMEVKINNKKKKKMKYSAFPEVVF